MIKDTFIIFVCLLTIVVGGAAIVGWVYHMHPLMSILPHTITMKFSTAVCFICSALIIFLIRCYLKGHRNMAHAFLPLPCLTIVLLMSVIMCAMFLRISTGIENLFVQDDPNAVVPTYAGHPSPVTMIDFFFVMIAGIITIAEPANLKRYFKIMGCLIALTGLSAAIGYLFNIPHLYFEMSGQGNAVAVNTAYLFLFLGIALMMLGQKAKIKP